MTTDTISPEKIRLMLKTRAEIALASNIPLSRLELVILDAVPRYECSIVVFDNGEGLVELGSSRLTGLGYSNVRVLDGGIEGWRRAGFELFQDVNSYCKAFGELVEAERHTPSLTANEVQELIDTNADVKIVDARRFSEFTTMSIPTSTSVPGAELVLRTPALVGSDSTTIIVNCAGRTRSIIGTQSLINAGLPNPVVALRNGTIGWTLAGQPLTHGQGRSASRGNPASISAAAARARAVAYRAGVRRLTLEELERLRLVQDRTLYCFDVRPPDEYIAGHIAEFRSAPGGQLVQETDVFAPVRNARVVLADDLGARADMTASWLAQMGWEVYVLDGGFDTSLETGESQFRRPDLSETTEIAPREVQERLSDGYLLVDLAPSPRHRAGHIPGARFGIRAQLDTALGGHNRVIFTSGDGMLAKLACRDVGEDCQALAVAGGTDAWIAAGLPLEEGMHAPLVPPNDVYKRPYEGTDNAEAAMQAYLDWEFGLVSQLERDGTHGFFVI
jgi:rhodanese-related sulfurtransferase